MARSFVFSTDKGSLSKQLFILKQMQCKEKTMQAKIYLLHEQIMKSCVHSQCNWTRMVKHASCFIALCECFFLMQMRKIS